MSSDSIGDGGAVSEERRDVGTAPQQALVKVDNVVKRFGAVTALKGVSLEIPPNSFFALLGPSGCGKTTLLKILAGLESPTSGDVLLDGEAITKQPPERRPFNLVFQNYALFPHLKVAKNLEFGPRRSKGGASKEQLAKEVGEMLHLVGLEGYEERMPSELSGGQAQRVALARALMKKPRLLLLDEPMSALDRNVRSSVREQLLRIHNELGTTFVLVTHDQEEALSMADTVALMNHGVFEQIGPPTTLYRRPASLFAARFIGAGSLVPVGVKEVRAETATVDLGGASLEPTNVDAEANSPGLLMLRPEELQVTSPEDGILAGEVLTSTFLGSEVEIAVATEVGDLRIRTTTVVGIGDRVGIKWDTSGGVLYASDEPKSA
ncbi:MAG: ABC transporter ATP-binding protein [Actinobacteria bacterium]|nr:ABC transporter ATP-binding protein [Actinomycetota bacterium]